MFHVKQNKVSLVISLYFVLLVLCYFLKKVRLLYDVMQSI